MSLFGGGQNLEYKYIKRIEDSEYFGSYLLVDLFNTKTCTFNCIFCRAGPTINQIPQRVYIYPIEKILREIEQSVENDGKIDYVKYTHRGDPTLYVLFGSLNKKIKEIYPKIKIVTCTNCSMLYRDDIFNELKELDHVIASLDSVLENEFQKINQPIKTIHLDDLLRNLSKFREEFFGEFWINTTLLKGYNDSKESLIALKKYLVDLNPEKLLITFESKNSENYFSDESKKYFEVLFSDVSFQTHIGVDRP
ncbi:MAG: radical SAM protein [Candidatus Heimdallarchaeota archaeon]|nr:radical SAM protein [Candidatus Heimdallarchaeota archaeon]